MVTMYRGVCSNCGSEMLISTDALTTLAESEPEHQLFAGLSSAELYCICGNKIMVRRLEQA